MSRYLSALINQIINLHCEYFIKRRHRKARTILSLNFIIYSDHSSLFYKILFFVRP